MKNTDSRKEQLVLQTLLLLAGPLSGYSPPSFVLFHCLQVTCFFPFTPASSRAGDPWFAWGWPLNRLDVRLMASWCQRLRFLYDTLQLHPGHSCHEPQRLTLARTSQWLQPRSEPGQHQGSRGQETNRKWHTVKAEWQLSWGSLMAHLALFPVLLLNLITTSGYLTEKEGKSMRLEGGRKDIAAPAHGRIKFISIFKLQHLKKITANTTQRARIVSLWHGNCQDILPNTYFI